MRGTKAKQIRAIAAAGAQGQRRVLKDENGQRRHAPLTFRWLYRRMKSEYRKLDCHERAGVPMRRDR